MRSIKIFILFLFVYSPKIHAQIRGGCIEQNSHILYSYPEIAGSYMNVIDSNTTYFSNGFVSAADTIITLWKTNNRQQVFAKKYRSSEPEAGPGNIILIPTDSSIIANSVSYIDDNFYLIRFSKDGNIIWAKKYNLSILGAKIHTGNQTNQSTVYKDGYIYVTINFSVAPNNYYSCIAKLDMWGNIIWSKSILTNLEPYSYIANPPSFINDTLHFISNIIYNPGSPPDSSQVIITKLNPTTGNIYGSEKIKLQYHNSLKGILAHNVMENSGSMIITGSLLPDSYLNKPFIINYNRFTNELTGWYANHNMNFGMVPSTKFALNKNGVVAINFDIPFFDPATLYLLLMDKNGNVIQSKIFRGLLYGYVNSLYLSESNIPYFGISGFNSNGSSLHYVTINNNDSLLCSGKDSAMFTPVALPLTKSEFTWPSVIDGLLTSTSFPLVESNTTIYEETICTDQSICDTIKITGPSKFCLPQDTATYTLHKNPLCKRKTIWQADTTAIKIIGTEGENIIKVKMLRPYVGYIKAWYDGCELADSLLVEVSAAMPSLSAGNDTMLCTGRTLTLKATPGFKTYQWNTGSFTDSTVVNNTGIFYLTATDSCDNIFTDSVKVAASPAFEFNYDNLICQFDTAHFILDNRFRNYSWQPADKGIISNGRLHLFPGTSTIYTINAKLLAGCIVSDTVKVSVENCPIYFYVPNAFTPNNDGINDIFKPLIKGPLMQYRFEIFNRLGNKIFSSGNPQQGWNGKYKNKPQDNAVFVWTCTYQFAGTAPVKQKGTVMLIR